MRTSGQRLEQAVKTEGHLVAAALALGARTVKSVSLSEDKLCRSAPQSFDAATLEWLRGYISRGNDPLGDSFCRIRSAEVRREKGATYTPSPIIRSMVQWARKQKDAPERIIDPGVGSARFLVEAAKVFPKAKLIGIDVDPLAALIARANLASLGHAGRSTIMVGDFRSLKLPPADGKTLYVGNPPYVRHHQIGAEWKSWLTAESAKRGYSASQLAGLHVHFFLATLMQAKSGDQGAFVTAAEWLDVNYGSLVRDLFLRDLGGQGLTVIEPAALPFADAAATAVVTTFQIGSRPKAIHVKRVSTVEAIEPLDCGPLVHRGRLETHSRWSHLTRRTPVAPQGYVELGELCRVHRGQVTGANRIWIAGPHSAGLPQSVLYRTVTKARELFAADRVLAVPVLKDDSALRDVIDLPADLSLFDRADQKRIEVFLHYAKAAGVAEGYVAGNRRAWWSVGLRAPAPILATYMARRVPAFVRNLAGARHINIAHGLYPREPLDNGVLDKLAAYLSTETTLHQGRTYAGGLTKFEPREMERIFVPSPQELQRA
jgi:adenine-specific DNA-methyltransferase